MSKTKTETKATSASPVNALVMLPIGEVVMTEGLIFPAKVDGYWQGGYRLRGMRGCGVIPNKIYNVVEVHRITPAEFNSLSDHKINCLLEW